MAFNPRDLTILFITYNRSEMLEGAVASIRACPELAGVRLVCADDGSKPEHRQRIDQMGFDLVVSAPKNGGLGRNNNRGLRATDSKYVLMVQDDCRLAQPQAIFDAIAVLESDPSIGMVRLNGDAHYFPLTQRMIDGRPYWFCDQSSSAYAKVKQDTSSRRRVYSDQPHVRRRELHESVVGYYVEGTSMEMSEMDYEDRMDAQTTYHVAFLSCGHENFFVHAGDASTSLRAKKLRYKVDAALVAVVNKLGLRNNPLFAPSKAMYRALQNQLERVRMI